MQERVQLATQPLQALMTARAQSSWPPAWALAARQHTILGGEVRRRDDWIAVAVAQQDRPYRCVQSCDDVGHLGRHGCRTDEQLYGARSWVAVEGARQALQEGVIICGQQWGWA